MDRATGKIVVAQPPNPLLIVFVCAFAGRLLTKPDGAAETIARAIEMTSLAAWALDELIRGVNLWRRTLGAGTCVYVLTWLLR